jgi:Flp pilus assembly protein TadG
MSMLPQRWAANLNVVGLLQQFRRSVAGVAAVEFALILPLMILIFLGMSELTAGINTDRKLTLLSRTLADLSSRGTQLDTSTISSIFGAARMVMQPYDSSKVLMVVTSVSVTTDSNGNATGKVDWSCALGPNATTAARPKDSSYTVPGGFKTAQSFMLVETLLNYVPMFGGAFMGKTGGLRLAQTTPWPVRSGTQVTLQGACP